MGQRKKENEDNTRVKEEMEERTKIKGGKR